MTNDEIKQLHYIRPDLYNRKVIRYTSSIPDEDCASKFYYPWCIRFYDDCTMLTDYSAVAEEYLASSVININTVTNTFIDNQRTRYIDISTLTLDQAQQIINKNVLLFNKITQLVTENELLHQLQSTL